MLGLLWHLVKIRPLVPPPANVGRPTSNPLDLRVPKTWATFRDPDGRYVLHYPAEWKLDEGAGTAQIYSIKLGSFARVDVASTMKSYWDSLRHKLREGGGRIVVRERSKKHAKGRLELGRRLFDWEAHFYPLAKGYAILSLGNVVDSRRGPSLETYEDSVLDRIHRHFTAIDL